MQGTIFAVKVAIETSVTDDLIRGAVNGAREEAVVVAGETDKTDEDHPHPEIIEVKYFKWQQNVD